jgi:hypothetical protein
MKGLFVATSFVAIISAAFAMPSIYWEPILALVMASAVIYAIQRAMRSPRTRYFWGSYLGGFATLFAMDIFVPDRWFLEYSIARPLWLVFKHDLRFRDDGLEFEGFQFAIGAALVVTVPAIVALVVQTFSMGRE